MSRNESEYSSMSKYPLLTDAEDPLPGLNPPRFGLSSVMAIISVAAVGLFALRFLGPGGSVGLVLTALAVVAHVLGNAIGTQLRDQSQPARRISHAIDPAEAAHVARGSQLGKLRARNRRLSRTLIGLSLASATVGAIVGGNVLAWHNAGRITPANLTLAVISSGVLGGIAGFAIFGFVRVAFSAWREALRGS